MRILFVGDINAKVGRRMAAAHIPKLRERHGVGLCIVNGENAAGGFGITAENAGDIFSAGADVITSGNHIWNRREARDLLSESRVLRPSNYPPGAPGKGMVVVPTPEGPVAVMNLMGRVFMPPVECPFREADRLLASLEEEVRMVVVDIHAEATSEKVALGWHLDGRVTAVLGTHTHIQTADERILPRGTAYLSDVGMTGPADSVIGMKTTGVLEKFLGGIPRRFEAAGGPGQINAVLVDADPATGKARSIERIFIREAAEVQVRQAD